MYLLSLWFSLTGLFFEQKGFSWPVVLLFCFEWRHCSLFHCSVWPSPLWPFLDRSLLEQRLFSTYSVALILSGGFSSHYLPLIPWPSPPMVFLDGLFLSKGFSWPTVLLLFEWRLFQLLFATLLFHGLKPSSSSLYEWMSGLVVG